MPTITRSEYNASYRRNFKVRVKVPFGDMKPKERHDYIKPRLLGGMAAFTAGVIINGLWAASGDYGHQDDEHAAKVMRARAASYYLALPTRGKFENTYVSPHTIEGDFVVGATGFRGAFKHAHTNYIYSFGQECLRGSAYDTTPSSIRTWTGGGDISAVASLTQAGDDVLVHPAGSNAPPLEFTDIDGELIPSPPTIETLQANGCDPISGLKVQLGTFEDELASVDGFYDTIHPEQN